MAGVGFSLRALGAEDSYTGLLHKYGAAGVIGSGPWLISILSLLFIGVFGKARVPDPDMLVRFQVSVTWLFAGSLILSGPFQLAFTRYVADLSFAERDDEVFPALLGALGLTSAVGAGIAAALSPLFSDVSVTYRVLMGAGFVTLCNIWLVVVVLGGLREHVAVLSSFAIGYAVTFAVTLLLAPYGEEGLLAGFVLGQGAVVLHGLWVLGRRLQQGSVLSSFEFARGGRLRLELLLVGLLYNLGIWVDKLLFWLKPDTSYAVLGPLRASEVYDLPIFLAYLTIVPGMATFLVRVETDFAEQHAAFYGAIRNGAPLSQLERIHGDLVRASRIALFDILKVQGITLALCVVLGPAILSLAGISELHLPLFYIDAAGVALQVLLLAVTSMFFYLDRGWAVAGLTAQLVVTNVVLTLVSQWLGPAFYGYGFALSVGITAITGLWLLDRAFQGLVRDTFMLQPVST